VLIFFKGLNHDVFSAVLVTQFLGLLLGRHVMPEHEILALYDIEKSTSRVSGKHTARNTVADNAR
jgi:hypothetical protein